MTITGKQIAMARILLDLSQEELADHIEIARKTIMRIENGQSPGSTTTIESLQKFFENSGVEFTDHNGVKERKNDIIKLHGRDGLRTIFDELYALASTDGGEICIFNGVPKRLIQLLGNEWHEEHAAKMIKVKDNFNYKIIIRHSDTFLVGHKYAQYRWFPEKMFNERTLYCYGSKLAFFDVNGEELTTTIMNHQEYAESFRILFNIAWNHVAITPPKKGEAKP